MAAEEEERGVISMQDVIEEEESLEATARAVLGPCDETNCTYPKVITSRETRRTLPKTEMCYKSKNLRTIYCIR